LKLAEIRSVVDAVIEKRQYNYKWIMDSVWKWHDLRPHYDFRLRVAVFLSVLDSIIGKKENLWWFEIMLENYGGLLFVNQRRTVILNALSAVINDMNTFKHLWYRFGSELYDEQRIAVLLNALDAASKNGNPGDFKNWFFFELRDLLENLGSKILSDERLRTVVLNTLDTVIKRDCFYNFDSTFHVLGGLLKPYGPISPKLLLSWAIEQFKKINKKANVAYSSKAIQQAIEAEGVALTEIQSISLAVNKYQEEKNDFRAFDNLYCTVKHAYHRFTSLYTSLHPIDVDME
jgi:hypothetical protein